MRAAAQGRPPFPLLLAAGAVLLKAYSDESLLASAALTLKAEGLLASAAGRRGLMGLSGTWQEASVAEVTQALQSMRLSSITLRQQAFQGLHDLACAPYFSGQESWAVLGYPGPRAV